ncbi:MAG TPA: DUF4178 domain-containing protein [Thermoanaerobaculia bacterium]|nr:DUF4178 domain-containing protein [Thermoanaerobaculia bacterium]
MSTANCPSCGGPIEFAIGSSAVVVCSYCRSIVARTDRGPEAHGKVAALVDTGSPLRVGLPGKYRGKGFRITGRTQMQHEAGGIWDEWYAAFDDGRWGWLAEAQGRYYVTFKTAANAPSLAELRLGYPVAEVESLVVAEIGQAGIASAEGELPWRPVPGDTYDYADLTGTERRFATIDYSEEPPVVFKGHEASLGELGVDVEPARASRVAVTKLSCSNCGGPLELRAPDQTQRVFCPNCGSAHDVTAGKLQFFTTLEKRKKVDPVIPLGSNGTIDGDEYVVAGFMQRSVKFDITYYWTEYLLFNREKGFRWLVHSDDHWSFVTPLRAGEVQDAAPEGVSKNVLYGGKSYRLFQDATAKVTYVLGEFYWKVMVGEAVDTADYVAPPEGISKEVTRSGAKEINYSHARYLTPNEVETAFGVKNLTRPSGIGPLQPFTGAKLGRTWLMMLALLFVAAMVLAVMKPRRVVLNQTYDVAAESASDNTRVLFTEPFELSGRHNLAIQASADVNQSWLYVAGDLVNEGTGRLESFEMPLEYYHGVSDGESWSEGKRRRRVYVSAPAKGRYTMRLEAQWERGRNPVPLHLIVREGVFRWSHFWLAALALSILPFFALVRRLSFESKRWKDSSHSPFGQLSSEEDDEE